MDVIDIEWQVRCTLRVDMTYENFEKLLNWKGKHKKPFIHFLCIAFYFPFKFDSYCKFLLAGLKVLWKKVKIPKNSSILDDITNTQAVPFAHLSQNINIIL